MKRVIACVDSSPCVNAIAEAAVWIAKHTNRELYLLQILDYYPASYHLGEISGVIGFESNAMLLKELAELEEKQSALALQYSNELLDHLSATIKEKHGLDVQKIQEKGDFIEQSLALLNADDVVVLGKVGQYSAEHHKAIGGNVENFIRATNSTVLTVGEMFTPPSSFVFAYEESEACDVIARRIVESDLLKGLACHLIFVGDSTTALEKPAALLREAGLEVKTEYRFGDVAENILDYQQQYNINLIILGAFSHNRVHQFFLGSVATEIFRNSAVPLLVAK